MRDMGTAVQKIMVMPPTKTLPHKRCVGIPFFASMAPNAAESEVKPARIWMTSRALNMSMVVSLSLGTWTNFSKNCSN